jgi:carboxymethylenebutenolidase
MPEISFPVDGGTGRGYLAVPAGSAGPEGAGGAAKPGPWPGVVVIHEAFGLNDDIRAKADQFAARGYLALAPDLYGGRPWLRCVLGAVRQLRAGSGPAFTALEAARGFLATQADCTGKVGVIGFCMGGAFALLCAPSGSFAAASANYGEVPQDAESALRGACPIVGSYGARDPMGTKHPERLQRALTVLEIPQDVKVYPSSGHRFMTEGSGPGAMLAKFTRMTYQEADAADAWQRIYAFFGEHLGA